MNHPASRNETTTHILSCRVLHLLLHSNCLFSPLPLTCIPRHERGRLEQFQGPFCMGEATSSPIPFLIRKPPQIPSHSELKQIGDSRRFRIRLGMVKNGNAHRAGGGAGGGRSYGLILLLALGAAILGVMVLHKLREGRLFSLLVKEKDHELLSLHLLLQKEREFNKEAQKKLEEMKTNMYSVTAQKSDVEGRLSEVKSLVSSLKDEQEILESQLEEKRSEIKMLRQQQMTPNEEIRFRDPTNQNQGENEDLRSHIEQPASVWSVSSDDPSNPPINFTKGEIGLAQGSRDEPDPDRSVEGAYRNKNETRSSSEHEKRKLEHTAEDGGKPSSRSSMYLNHGNEEGSFRGQRSTVEREEKSDNSVADHAVETEKREDDMNSAGFVDGSDSAIRVKDSKQRRLKRRRYRDLIRRFREGRNGNLEHNEVETKERKDSSAGKVQAHSGREEDQAREQRFDEDSKEIDKGSDHVEDEEETKSSKDEEHKTN